MFKKVTKDYKLGLKNNIITTLHTLKAIVSFGYKILI